jgi:hypothetical protein
MADLTHGAVDSLLGILSGAIKDEAQLLSGVQGDIQFIRDEMDSMNGFLLHLTKSGDDHDDQQRAWMKQVRDIAYIAQDCIELYMRDLAPPEKGIWARMRHVPVLLKTWWPRHRLANRLRDLKVRVRDVGERRQRYGVTVPEAKKGNTNKNATGLHGGKGVSSRPGTLSSRIWRHVSDPKGLFGTPSSQCLRSVTSSLLLRHHHRHLMRLSG